MSSRDRRRQNSSGLSRRQQHNADKRRSANAVGLADFSQKKGQVRALEEFKKRKNRKNLETSIALRRYRKLMNREGMRAGTGASRKRQSDGDETTEREVGWNEKKVDSDGSCTDEDADNIQVNRERRRVENENVIDESNNNSDGDSDGDSDSDVSESQEEMEDVGKLKQKQKPKKMDPFKKSRERAKIGKQRIEDEILRRESNEKDRQRKLKRRKQQTKLLQQRTKRGQPIMKHAIDNLLYKLEKREQNDKSPAKFDNDDRRRSSNKRDFPKPNQSPNVESSLQNKKKKRTRKFY